MSNTFRALWVEADPENPKQFTRTIVDRSLESLPEHELLIDVQYSSLNYKDALSAHGSKAVTREFPHTPGIDAAGVVISDKSNTFQPGDEVIACGYDLGMNTSGALAERIAVPAGWAVKKPEGLSLRDAMCYGTAGFTSALCVNRLLEAGAKPEDGPVAVTGATGGVGTFAVAILAKLGFETIAFTGKLDASDFLKSLGATEVRERSSLDELSARPLGKPEWAHAVDCVGGEYLFNLLKATKYYGAVAACGLAASAELNGTVLPFILRGISLLGVDCVELPLEKKAATWQTIADAFKVPEIAAMVTEINLDQAPESLEKIMQGKVTGRYLVNINA